MLISSTSLKFATSLLVLATAVPTSVWGQTVHADTIHAWMVCQTFIKLLEMKNASDKAEAQAAARRRQEEGNSFIVSDGNGGTLTMNRIGDTDDFACSDGHTYTRSGGSSGYYGDYEKRY